MDLPPDLAVARRQLYAVIVATLWLYENDSLTEYTPSLIRVTCGWRRHQFKYHAVQSGANSSPGTRTIPQDNNFAAESLHMREIGMIPPLISLLAGIATAKASNYYHCGCNS